MCLILCVKSQYVYFKYRIVKYTEPHLVCVRTKLRKNSTHANYFLKNIVNNFPIHCIILIIIRLRALYDLKSYNLIKEKCIIK